jgi:hypothetical protein
MTSQKALTAIRVAGNLYDVDYNDGTCDNAKTWAGVMSSAKMFNYKTIRIIHRHRPEGEPEEELVNVSDYS